MKTKQVEWKKGRKSSQLHPKETHLSKNTGLVETNGFIISRTYKEI